MLLKRTKTPVSIHDEKKASNSPLSYKTIHCYMISNQCLTVFIIRKNEDLCVCGGIVVVMFQRLTVFQCCEVVI